jgi:protein involved in polysaccharide export with SLBB domain
MKSLAQASNPLSDEFLAGLPPSVAEELLLNNAVAKEEEIEKLFRADTKFTKSKDILEKIRYELKMIEKRIDAAEGTPDSALERFGDSFFSTIQSSFMPVNVPSSSSTYVVDVGDEFSLMLTGTSKISASTSETQIVQRDGTLLIPSIGKLKIAGLTLGEAENAISEYLERTSPGVTSYVSLSKIRDIDILMLGGIISPGIFTLGGGSNILTALNAAGGVSEKGSYRKIEHKRAGETIQIIDLYQVFIFGNINFKTSLRSGDVVLVHPIQNSIPVTGGVNKQAIFEALPGETAADLVKYAGGFSSAFKGHQNIFVKRSDISSNRIIDLPAENMGLFPLEARDILLIPSYSNILEPAKEVLIEGLVNRPGQYYVDENETLSELIKRAGGYKENAYEFGGALYRKSIIDAENEFAQLNYFETIRFIISNLAQPGMNVNSDTAKLLAEELRAGSHDGRVVTEFNLNHLAKNPSHDILLEHNDRIVIPQMQKVVYLFGDFKNPSNVTYSPNSSIKDYIKMAGGLNKSAQKEMIVIDPSGSSQSYKMGLFASNKTEIYPGSIIYVPRDIARIDGIRYAASVSPILSSLALSLASLNSIKD